jgi:S1-C subfamily serine protease
MYIRPLLLVALSLLGVWACQPVNAAIPPVEPEEVQEAEEVLDPLDQIATEMLEPTVQLERNCSGVVVHSDRQEESGEVLTLVLTAKHCTDNLGQLINVFIPVYDDENRMVQEQVFKAVVGGRYGLHDLAYLRLLDTDTVLENIATLAEDDTRLREAEPIWAVGYGLGWTRTITEGTFGQRQSVAFPDANRPNEYFRATPAIIGGNSGGPLFHRHSEGHYEVIGITSAGSAQTNHINLFVPMDSINEYMEMVLRMEESRLSND